jgi:glucose/arabinose dehydrogenase
MRVFLLFFLALPAWGGVLPGFRVERVGRAEGFVSSIVVDSRGTIYVTTTDGWVHRLEHGLDNAQATRVASLPTHSGSNGGLLGMALLDDATAVVHYTVWGGEDLVLDDVISTVDLGSGVETVLHAFACDVETHAHGASGEHHGGNPTVAPNGAIFVGIGEYGAHTLAQRPGWNGGRIWRIDPSTGEATQWAMGLRNPFDVAWDPESQSVVASDNGADAGDEINVIAEGSNCGWPLTFGNGPAVEGMLAPVYVFPDTVAPTGLARLDGANDMLRRGFLSGTFVAQSLFYFPSLAAPAGDPIAIVDGFDEAIIDVTQAASGEIYFVTASFAPSTSVYRLRVPKRGDCNGDGVAGAQDMLALLLELGDGDGHPMIEAQDGAYAGSWGCDANADGLITSADREELRRLLGGKRRAVR